MALKESIGNLLSTSLRLVRRATMMGVLSGSVLGGARVAVNSLSAPADKFKHFPRVYLGKNNFIL